MKPSLFCVVSLFVVNVCLAAPPSFRNTSIPEGWTLVRGEAEPGSVRSAKPAVPLDLKTTAPIALPVEATFRFRAMQGDAIAFQAGEEAKDAKPLLQCTFRPTGPNQMALTAQAAGEPMATTAVSTRTYTIRGKSSGA